MSEVVTKPLNRPNVCFVCEHSNEVKYVDTKRVFSSPFPFPRLDGTKYLCEDCVRDAANVLDFVSPEQAEKLKNRVAEVEAELAAANTVQAAVTAVNELSEALQAASVPAVTVKVEDDKPKPKKSAAKKSTAE